MQKYPRTDSKVNFDVHKSKFVVKKTQSTKRDISYNCFCQPPLGWKHIQKS